MSSSWESELARRYLGAHRRSRFGSLIGLFSLAGVFIGTSALVVATSFMNGFTEQVRDRLIGRDSHIDFLSWGAGLPDGDSLPDQIVAADPRVVAASPFIVGKAGISHGRMADGVVVEGIDPARASKVVDISRFVTSGRFDLSTFELDSGRVEHGILLGSYLAANLGVDTGDRVTLLSLSTPEVFSGAAAPRYDRARVTGIFHSGMYEYDANLAYVSIATAQKLYRAPHRVTGIQVRVADLWKAHDVGAKVVEAMGGSLVARDWFQKNETLMKWMNLEKVVVFLALCLIVIVAAFNIASSLIMGVLERTREIGILRAMGASSRSIRRVFLLQGLMAGLGGAIGGMLFGLLLCLIQDRFHVLTIPGSVYFIDFLPVSIHATDMVLIFTCSVAISVLAALLPAWKASRLDPVEAVRHE